MTNSSIRKDEVDALLAVSKEKACHIVHNKNSLEVSRSGLNSFAQDGGKLQDKVVSEWSYYDGCLFPDVVSGRDSSRLSV